MVLVVTMTPVMYVDPTGYDREDWNLFLQTIRILSRRFEKAYNEEFNGTLSVGQLNTTSVWHFTGSSNYMVSLDGHGDYAYQFVGAGGGYFGFGIGGIASLLVGANIMYTTADSVDDLNGIGFAGGGTLGAYCPQTGIGMSLGLEYVRDYFILMTV